jgi:hypothetical protein
MSCVNATTDALSIGPFIGYIQFLVIVHVLLLFTAYVSSGTHMHIHVVTYITLVFWIKLKLIVNMTVTTPRHATPHHASPFHTLARWWWWHMHVCC